MCLSVCWTLGAIATVLVILRIYSRLRLVTRGGGWALFWAVLAWVCFFAQVSCKYRLGCADCVL